MRRLSEIKGEDAVAVIGSALPIIEKMIKAAPSSTQGKGIEFFGNLLKSTPSLTLQLMSVIDGRPIEDYENMSIIEMLKESMEMMQDEDLLALFK